MKKIFFLYSILLLVISCEDFIDTGLANDQVEKEDVYRDVNMVNAAMAGLLRSLSSNGYLSGGLSGGGLYFGNYTDELISYQAPESNLDQLYKLKLSSRSNIAFTLWQTTYSQIFQANSLLSGIDESSLPIEKKNIIKGQAMFIRSLLYYYLVQTYGSVPYVTSTDYSINKTLGKLPVDEVLKAIGNDLIVAKNLLPKNSVVGQRFYPSKEACLLLQTRLALAHGKWQDVIMLTDELVMNNSYSLSTNISSAYLKNNPSTIWQFAAPSSTAITSEASIYTIYFAPPYITSVNPRLVKSFSSSDLRLKNWITMVTDFLGNQYYYASKYKQVKSGTAQQEFSIVLRYEEVILSRAEAFARLGNISASTTELNKIIFRAGLPLVTNFTQSDLLTRILEERRHEFFTEFGHRFFDLKRFGNLNEEMLNVKSQWKSNYSLFPIPEQEILLNSNLSPQNEGY